MFEVNVNFGHLPPGFREVVGDTAARYEAAERRYLEVAVTFGFDLARVPQLAYAVDYERFGTAAQGRMFDFVDRGGRHVALTANSLVAMLRASHNSGLLRSRRPASIAGKVVVARHRHKPQRSWTQLVATICNEKYELAADLTLLRLWHTVIISTGPNTCRFEYRDFGILDAIAKCSGVDAVTARRAVYQKDKRLPADPAMADLLGTLEKLSAIDIRLSRNDQFAAAIAIEPMLSERITHLREIFHYAQILRVEVDFQWDWTDAPEYRSGLCFRIRGADGETLVEGGGYHHVVSAMKIGVDTCWSSAGSTERLAAMLPTVTNPMVHLLGTRDVDEHFFVEVAQGLRADGFAVREHWHVPRITREIRRLTRSPDSWFAVIGTEEKKRGVVVMQNLSKHTVHREWTFPPA